MPKRELFAIVALPIVLAVIILLPAWVFLALVGTAVLLAGNELLGMALRAGVRTMRWLPLALLAGAMVASWRYGANGFLAAMAMVVVVLPAAQLRHRDAPAGSLAGVATASFGVLYLGLTAAALGWLRLWPSNDDTAIRLLLLYLGTIWLADSGAYYVGSRFGRHRMSPRISPKKTWEGLAGGIVTAYLAAAALHRLLELDLTWPHVAAIATILAVSTPLGDLVESQLKRDCGVKDSSGLLPGHGGLLDRTDSLLYSAPPFLGYLMAAGLL